MDEDRGRGRRQRPAVVLAVMIALLSVGTIVAAVGMARSRSTSPTTFCHLDGLISNDGSRSYHRDPNQDCRFVDDQGNPPPTS